MKQIYAERFSKTFAKALPLGICLFLFGGLLMYQLKVNKPLSFHQINHQTAKVLAENYELAFLPGKFELKNQDKTLGGVRLEQSIDVEPIVTNNAVVYKGIYEGIDWKFYGKGKGKVAYDFILEPGANPEDIRMELDNVDQAYIDPEGSLIMAAESGRIRHTAPMAYQEIAGGRVEVESQFVVEDDFVGIELGEYDEAYQLIIDPTLEMMMDVCTKSVSTDMADPDEVFTYTINFTCPSTVSGDCDNVIITDVLPSEVELVNLPSGCAGCSFTEASNTFTGDLGTVPNGSTVSLGIQVRFPDNVLDGAQAMNTASVMYNQGGPQTASSNMVTTTATNGIVLVYDDQLRVDKRDAQAITTNLVFDQSVDFGHTSDETVTNLVVQDILPDGVYLRGFGLSVVPCPATTVDIEYLIVNTTSNTEAWTASTLMGQMSDDAIFCFPNSSEPNTNCADGGYNLAADEYIKGIRIIYGSLPGDGCAHPDLNPINLRLFPGFDETLTGFSDPMAGEMIENCAQVSADVLTQVEDCGNLNIQEPEIDGLFQKFVQGGDESPYQPGDEIEYTIRIGNTPTGGVDLTNPTIVDIVPPEFEIVSIGDAFTQGPVTINAGSTTLQPTITTTADYNGVAGQTRLVFSWDDADGNGITLPMAGFNLISVRITFRVKPSASDMSVISNVAYGGVSEENLICDLDVDDVDGDGDTMDRLCESTVDIDILYPPGFAGLDSYKEVRGNLDTEFSRFPSSGMVSPGGNIEYNIVLENPMNLPQTIDDIVLVDVLPHVGDRGVVANSELRESAWQPEFTATTLANLQAYVAGISGATLYFSTICEPCLAADLGAPVTDLMSCSAPNWTTTPPATLSDVCAFKIEYGTTFELAPGESTTINMNMMAPSGVPTDGSVAWNSFGFVGNKEDGSALLASEPIKVGISAMPYVPTCPTTCASGEMRLSFADAGWNNGAGWTDNATTPQTYMNFDGMGNNVSITLSGNAPDGGDPGPNVYSTNPAGCTEALRLSASNTSNSIADFPTETISFDNPIDFRKMYVGGMEQRNASGNAEVSVLTFSNGGTPIDPNNFTYTPLDAAHVDYAILNNVLYVYGILEDENGVLSIESNGILVDEIVWAIGEIEDNAVSVENFDFSGGASSQWISPICYLPTVVSNCALSLAATQASCTDNMDGSFTATYDVEVSWMDAPGDPGEMINITLDGGNTMSIDPTTMTSPQTVQFTVDADGTSTHTIAAEFSSDATCNASTTFKAPIPCVTDLGFTPGDVCNNLAAGEIGGTVWEDFNYNGIQDETTIVGVAGVQVNVTGCDGTALGTTYTDASGNWVFDISAAPSCNGCNDVQIEYILPETVSCWAKVTQAGTDNGTMIQFVGEGNCASMGVAAPVDYCQTNPTLGIACYVNGLGTNDTDGFLTIDYNSSGTEITDPYNAIATTEAIGSVWGSAYQRSQERLFNATFLKRHTGMADGPGYVYYFNVNPDNGNLVGGINSFNLEGVSPANVGSALGGTGTIQLGSICRDGSCGSPASDYTLPANPADPSVDLDAFGKVGKISFGDIDLQEDGNTLWMTNVNSDQLSLISVDVSGANPLGTVNRYLLDNMGGVPSCTNGEPRIWALKFHKGRGYLGLICDASISQNSSDLEGYILSFDPQNMGAGFNIELNYSLNYDNNPSLSGGQWYAWVDNWADKLAVDADPKVHPQPLVSDIEFDEEGNMLIGHMDRFPHQRAVDNHFPLSGNTDVNTNAFAWGDLIKACKTSTGYEVAGSGSCPTNFLNGVGPFGNGFFHSLRRGDEAPVGFGGAMAVLRGSDELLATYVDPIPPGGTFGAPEFLDVQGLQWFSNTTGDKTDSYRVYRSGFPFFGKGYGLGDIELMCDPAPLEIGNYVWEDTDMDGIQDACEPGIPGVSVELYDAAGTTLIGVATTDMNGQYYFNATNVDENGVMPDGSATVGFTGLSPNTSYVVQITNAEGGSQQAALTGFELTATDANGNNSDKIDNDASSDGTNATIMAMTADAGCNDHSFDFGFIQSCIEPSAITLSQGAATCDMLGLAENNGTISLATATDGTHYGISTLNAGTYDGPTTVGAATMIPASLPAVIQMNTPNVGGTYIVRIFNTDDDCFVEETVVVNAVVCDCVDPILTSLTDESICEGGSFTAANVTTSVTNSIPVTYQWYNNNGSDNPTTDALNGETTAVLTALPTATGSYSYRVEATSTLDGSCNASETVNLTIHPQPDIDDLADVNICSGDSYELPMITGNNLTGNEGYYTGSGGTGMQLNVGDMITTAQTIYIYDITATMPMCNDEESFTVSIIPNPDVADLEDQIICAGESYELPMITGTNLTGNEGYYTGPGGSGTALNVGDMITTSQTIYIYDATATMPVCIDEESFTVTVLELDLGDLPTTYPTLLANDGARHCVPSVPELYLGSTVDTESEGQASNLADGDDTTDDEDGVFFTTPMVPGSMACIEVSVVNDLVVDAYLQAWIDFNGDDTFDDGEELLSGDFTGSGIVINPGGVNNQRYCFEVPVDATFAEGMAFVRFRLSSAGGLSYDGFASDGEVEDYKLNLGKIGNLVFEDYDFDGIQDAGEPGIDGVTVGLTWFGADGVEGGGDDVVYTDLVTGSGDFDTGEYYFCGLSDGSYKVTFTTPENMTPTRTDIGGNNEQDSDGVLMGMDLSMVMETFTIAEATMLPTDESGNGDNGTTPTNGFADEQTDETHDQGFAFLDYGDLPDDPMDDTDYPTLMEEGGAVHVVIDELYLGGMVDGEQDGQPSALADGDDADEDGIVFATPLIPGNEACIEVTAVNTTGSDATLQGWIDWDGNGMLDAGEALSLTNNGLVSGSISGESFCFEVPSDAAFNSGMVLARFRLSPNGGLMAAGPDKFDEMTTVPQGEVEDYKLNLGKIGNLVFEDYDFDGIQDAGEPGIDGVTVGLTWFGADGVEGGGDDVVYTDLVTGSGDFDTGEYYFCGLSDGSYKVTFTTPENMTPTRTDIGGNNEQDSDGVLMGMDLSRVMETFTIAEATMLPTDESGTGDNGTTPTNGFADEQTDETHDQGFAFLDYGDLPDDPMDDTDYPTLMEEGGAVHVMIDELYLGGMVDGEQDGQPSALADGDDADEDGIVFATPLIPGNEACIEVTAVNTTGSDATLQGWIDWDGNGMLDAGEALSLTNNGVVSGSISGESFCFEVPSDAAFNTGMVLARFRLSPNGGLMAAGPDKFDEMTTVPQGEVEDYKLNLSKVGQWVWFDLNDNGVQDVEESTFGLNDVPVVLRFAGADGVFYTDDDLTYNTTTQPYTFADDSSLNGVYYYCGLIDGKYRLEVDYDEAAGLEPALADQGSEDMDSDGVELVGADSNPIEGVFGVMFEIDNEVGNREDEGGIGDADPGNTEDPNEVGSFPDLRVDQSFDFGLINTDLGDLPEGEDFDYPTVISSMGAEHMIPPVQLRELIPFLYLGDGVDSDEDGAPSEDADGDNLADMNDDEDGVRLLTPLIPGYEACFEIKVTIPELPANTIGYLQGWIDFDGSGTLDADEQIITNRAYQYSDLTNGQAAEVCFTVPADAVYFEGGLAYARFRLSTQADLGTTGLAPDGEVEDYQFELLKVGNTVWADDNEDGQADPTDLDGGQTAGEPAFNGVPVQLTFAGDDNTFGTSDDRTYQTTTANLDGVDGQYTFCGLILGEYRLEVVEDPEGYIPTVDNCAEDDLDSDGVPGIEFSLPQLDQVLIEGGFGDNDDGTNFPDIRKDETFDFGYLTEPEIKGAIGIVGVDYPESEICGHFNVIFDACFKNTGGTPLRDLNAYADLSAAEYFGSTVYDIVSTPALISSDAQVTPTLNDSYDGTNNLFMDNTGLLYPGEQVCLRFVIEVNPEADEAPVNPNIQLDIEAKAVNYQDKPIPDWTNGGEQYIAEDLSDGGTDPMTSNTGYPGDTGGEDDVTPLTDCWEKSRHMAANNNVNLTLNATCNMEITPDMIIENHFADCDMMALPLGGYYRVKLLTGDEQGFLTNPFDATQLVGQQIIAVVENVSRACLPVWGYITLEDKDGSTGCIKKVVGLHKSGSVYTPISNEDGDCNDGILNKSDYDDGSGNLDWEDESINLLICTDVPYIQDVASSWNDPDYDYYTGSPQLLDNCTDVTITRVADQLTDYECDLDGPVEMIEGRLVSSKITRTFYFEDTEGNEGSISQEICFFKPVIYLPECKKHLNVCVYGDSEQSNTEESLNPSVIESAPYYLNGKCEKLYLDSHTCNATVTFEDQVLPGTEHCGFKIIRTWTILDWCWEEGLYDQVVLTEVADDQDCPEPTLSSWDNKSLTYEQHLIIDDTDDPVVSCPVVDTDWDGEGDPLVYAVGPFNCSASFEVPAPEVGEEECGYSWTVRVYTEKPVLWHGVPTGEIELVEYLDATIFNQIDESTWTTEYVLLSDIPKGYYYLDYIVEDHCGNIGHVNDFDPEGDLDIQKELLCGFEVVDNTEPSAVCDDQLNVSVGSGSGADSGLGFARVYAEDVDEGSWDNCSPIWLQVRRFVPADIADLFVAGSDLPLEGYPNNPITLNKEGVEANGQSGFYTYFADYVDFICADVGQKAIIELGVWDDADMNGLYEPGKDNFNTCWLETLVEDKINPICEAPHDITIRCDEVPFFATLPEDGTKWGELSESEQENIRRWFGDLQNEHNTFPKAWDNCEADVAMIDVEFDLHCKAGTVTRIFQATDASGRQSASCSQVITLTRYHDYCITFPKDAEATCGNDPNIPGVELDEQGCDLLAISIQDERFDVPTSSDECYKIFRTYRVLNWCQFEEDLDIPGGEGEIGENDDVDDVYYDFTYFDRYTEIPPFIVSRDEDDDGNPGDENVTVRFITKDGQSNGGYGTIYVDRNCDPFDGNPSVNGGYWRKADTPQGTGSGTTLVAGFYQYTQVIKVYDQIAPVQVVSGETEFPSYTSVNPGEEDKLCTGIVTVMIEVTEECTPDGIRIVNEVVLNPDPALGLGPIVIYDDGIPTTAGTDLFGFTISGPEVTGEFTRQFTLSGEFPIGAHELEVTVMDGCGNDDADFIDFTVFDAKAPVPICNAVLTTDLMPVDTNNDGIIDDGMIAIWASDFIASPNEDCSGPVTYSIALASEIDGGAEPDINQTSLTLGCEDVSVVIVYVYAWDTAGNKDRCEAMIIVNDNNGLCEPQVLSGVQLAGLIETEENQTVSNVEVGISGQMNDQMMTTVSGTYQFTDLQKGYDYSITPLKDVDHRNGISTFDLVVINKHILGVEPLDSPYKMIAADVNNSRSITTLDIIQLRKLILSITTNFSSNTSWRFVEASFEFPDRTNPWLTQFPELINFNDLEADQEDMDFIAVKVGDVTGDAKTNEEAATIRNLQGQFDLMTTDIQLEAGQEHAITFSSNQLDAIQGFQSTLAWTSALDFVRIESGLMELDQFGVHRVDNGILTTSWNQPTNSLIASGELFTLVVKARENILLSEVLSLNSKYTVTEAYPKNYAGVGNVMDVAIDFGNAIATASGFKLYQNIPNPYHSKTIIGFDLPTSGEATLRVFNANGQLVYELEGEYGAGYHELEFDAITAKVNGVLYYTLETEGFTATKRMVALSR